MEIQLNLSKKQSDDGEIVTADWLVGETPKGRVIIKQADLALCCANIRQILGNLNTFIMNNSDFDKIDQADIIQYNSILFQLHNYGYELHELLVEGNDRIRYYLDGANDQSKLKVYLNDINVVIPVGFACNRINRRSLDTRPSKHDFADFWALRFKIKNWLAYGSCDYSTPILDSSKFKALFAIDKEEWKDAAPDLKQSFPEMLALYGIPLGRKEDWEKVRDAWRNMAAFHGLVFIFAQSDGVSIKLGGMKCSGNMIANMFRVKRLEEKHQSNILFVNTCLSAIGDPSGATSILSLATNGYFDSFIGTEAEISNKKGLLCATHFMNNVCFKNKSLEQAFELMREEEKLFPVNLFYTLYGSNEFKLDAPLSIGDDVLGE